MKTQLTKAQKIDVLERAIREMNGSRRPNLLKAIDSALYKGHIAEWYSLPGGDAQLLALGLKLDDVRPLRKRLKELKAKN